MKAVAYHLAGALLATSPVAADSDPTVGVLPMELSEGASDVQRTRLQARIVAGLSRAGLVSASWDPAERSCSGAECAKQAVAALDVGHVVRARVDIDGRDYHYTLELLDSEARSIAIVEEDCSLCGLAEAAQMLEDEVVLLAASARSLEEAPPILRVETVPLAEIEIDDEFVGSSPLSVPTTPGLHTIRARTRGFEVSHMVVEMTGGVERQVHLDLVRRPMSQRLRPLGWALAGTGLATIAAGAVLLAIDDRPHRASCSGTGRDAQGRCLLLYDTKVGGAVAVAVGATALISGTVLLALRRHGRRGRG